MKMRMPLRHLNSGLLEPFRQEVERLFQRYVSEPLEGFESTLQTWEPDVDIEDTPTAVVLNVDLPGVDPKTVEISIMGGALVLKGERKEPPAAKDKQVLRSERSTGPFYRELELPAGVDPDKIAAAGCKGVITITIPKKPEAQTKKIPITIEDEE